MIIDELKDKGLIGYIRASIIEFKESVHMLTDY